MRMNLMNVMHLTPQADGTVEWPSPGNSIKTVVTVGAFDGMHLGHQAVIARVVELAKRYDALSSVILFDPRPAYVHAWAAAHEGVEPDATKVDAVALTSMDERLRRIEQLGVDQVLIVHYTLAFAAKSYVFFLGQLTGRLGMRTLVLGSDAAMGQGRKGDVKAIANLAAATGVFELDVVDDLGPGHVRVPAHAEPHMPGEYGEPKDPLEGMSKAERRAWSKRNNAKLTRVWSSSNVRYLLSQGRIVAANAVLGHPHSVEGVVVHGEERGRTIGFPTANLGDEIHGYLPVDGVYAGWLVDLGTAGDSDADGSESTRLRADSPCRWPSAISIGTKPTFSEKTGLHERVVEAYAIRDDDAGWLDLYGHRVRVEFVGFLRPQVRFDGPDALVAELGRNVEETRRLTARIHA